MTGSSGMAGRPPAAVRALQAALAAEHTAVYGYGVAGGHLTGHRRAVAQQDWAAHETARDALAALITAHGAVPVTAAVSYRLPFPVTSAGSAMALAALLEDRVETAYLGLVALAEPALRLLGARSLQAAALRAAAWRGHTTPFPGFPVSPARRR